LFSERKKAGAAYIDSTCGIQTIIAIRHGWLNYSL